jgi:TonB-dependent starch-binding outer membrane protein SusC
MKKAFRKIVLMVTMLLCVHATYAQVSEVRGTVVDDAGQALIGASVYGKGSSRGTLTNAKGEFLLRSETEIAEIVVSYVGMITRTVDAKSDVGTITMVNKNRQLNDVVAIGYGSRKSKEVTGSIVSIKSKDFQQGLVTTPEQLIVGKAPGLQITSNGGAPGAGSRIRIRGGASLSGNNDPLIVIDGMPIDNFKMGGSANPLNMINANDIESVDILKDAASTAIYGLRGTNGVILITTKRGARKAERLNVSFSSVASVGTPGSRRVDMMNSREYRDLAKLMLDESQQNLLGKDSTNWTDLLFRNARTLDNNVSLTGGLKGLPYRLSFGYMAQQGMIRTSGLDRYSGGLTINPSFFNNTLRVTMNVKNTLTNTSFIDEGAVIAAGYNFDPTQSVRSASDQGRFDGYTQWINPATDSLIDVAPKNPIGFIYGRSSNSVSRRLLGNVQVDYKLPFLKGLTATINTGLDRASTDGLETQSPTGAQGFLRGGKYANYGESRISSLFDGYLNYAADLGTNRHKLDGTVGYSYQNQTRNYPTFNDYSRDSLYAPAGIPFKTTGVLLGYFGRVNYTFAQKLLVSAVARMDYASRFAPDVRRGFFPAVSAAYIMSQESFLKGTAVNNLKLRGSWGRTGNAEIYQNDRPMDYLWQSRYNISNPTAGYMLGNTFVPMYRPEAVDQNITWEKTATTNFGLDWGIWRNRVSGSIDLYNRQTTDLFAFVNVPAATALSNRLLTNAGTLNNRGVEVNLNLTPIASNNVTWDVNFNYTHNRNKIVSLGKVDSDSAAQFIETGGISGGVGNTIQILTPGASINSFYALQQVYDANGKPVEGAYVDQNGDGIINGSDKIVFKSGEPRNLFGISSNLSYRRVSLGFIARGQTGAYAYNNIAASTGNLQSMYNSQGFLSNVHGSYFDTRFRSQQLLSNYYIENSAFFRLDNLNLGYNFGSISRSNTGANLRVSASCQNVFVITKYTGLDPEVLGDKGNGGIDDKFYARPRIYSLGVHLDF